MPEISVIVPVYKVEKYLNRCVDSILAQSFTDFELILVDDGSPDNCGIMCDDYAKKDNRVFVIHKENGGLSDARNAGIDWTFSHSDSKWITFIDSDDWIDRRYLELLFLSNEKNNTEIAACQFDKVSDDFIPTKEEKASIELITTETYYISDNINATVAWAKLYKKSCFQNIRYPIGKLHEDEYVTYRLLFKYDEISFVNNRLYHYYNNNQSITRSEWTPKGLDGIAAVEEQLEFFSKSNLVVLEKRKETYWRYLVDIIEILQNCDNNKNQKVLKHVRNRLRKGLIKYKALPIKKYLFYYDKAFPIFRRCKNNMILTKIHSFITKRKN